MDDGDELVAQCPAKSLADDAPTYYLETEEPAYLRELQNYYDEQLSANSGQDLQRIIDRTTTRQEA